jgi:hypothetical protein
MLLTKLTDDSSFLQPDNAAYRTLQLPGFAGRRRNADHYPMTKGKAADEDDNSGEPVFSGTVSYGPDARKVKMFVPCPNT